MEIKLKFDTSKFDRAFARFLEGSKRNGEMVLRDQARLFVRDAASVTPPNVNGKFRKGLGVSAVKRDIAKIMRPVTLAKNDPVQVHRKFRTKRGRIKIDLRNNATTSRKRKAGKKLDGRFAVSKPRLDDFRKKRVDRVGMLASGWVAAAKKLGTRLPEWITRHGRRFGGVRVFLSRTGISVKVWNSIPYIGGIEGMERRVQWALNNRARQINKQLADKAIRDAARKAGLKT